ncbi:MAG: hypothetical protein OJF59_002511 [Cytophagales bacterium]|jgi:hypothetical protein|nr:hypothetical protein [Bacteroidota bacterium]MBS1980235.1 hypothetical protein [Bacteroidota bacterium]WHZ08757.1 MAG: hypothetical protein OJF59_002511 [Cytophagales bacterium]
MTKHKEKKLHSQLVELLKAKNNYHPSDELLIEELIDFKKISDYAKSELGNNPGDWQALTTITMVSKQMQSILTKLNITPQERVKKIKEEKKDKMFDLQKFLNNG